MKKVILKSLTLTNFKGEKDRTTEFHPDVTTIKGANGLGKSRHFDAFIWLLFGKDSQDRKDYEIKTRVGGNELRNVDVTVSAVLTVDGEEITLKRSFVEEWVKPRGEAERVFKGNRTECWWNEVPVSVTEYGDRVSKIIDDTLFKMLTNPTFFVNMSTRLQRETLLAIAGDVTDAQIAQKRPEFAALLDKISGKPLSDYKAELAAKKRLLKARLAEISPRIDQTQKMKPADDDFAAIEKEIERIDAEIGKADEAINDYNKAARNAYDEERAKVAQINDLRRESQDALFRAQSEEDAAAYKANRERRRIAGEHTAKQNEVYREENNIAGIESDLKITEEQVKRTETALADLRHEWSAENARAYDGSDVCSFCGQDLPESDKAAAREKFAAEKERRLGGITSRGQAMSERLKELKEQAATIKENLELYRNRRAGLEKEAKELEAVLSGMPEVTSKILAATDVPECIEIDGRIAAVEATLRRDTSASPGDLDMAQKRTDLTAAKEALVKRLSARDAIKKADDEIRRLGREEKDLANQIAEVEGDEIAIQDFIRAKIDICEANINRHFRYVQFKLYDTTIDGDLFEVCIPLIGGVPYGTANLAGKVNAGLDIINALCRFYGVCAPIFIDQRESVNELIPTESQIINLVVSKDRKLIVE